MKHVRYTCDGCGGKVPKSMYGRRQHLIFRMVTFGYGMQDGEHKERAHICSAACGLTLLKKWITAIETAE